MRHTTACLDLRAWLVRALCLVAVSCTTTTPRTEVMLIVDAEPAVRGRAASLQVELRGYAAGDPAHADSNYGPTELPMQGDGAYAWPVHFGLTPNHGDAARSFDVTVRVLDQQGQVFGVVRARSGFVARKTLALELVLETACLDESSAACSDDETCRGGQCQSDQVDAQALPMFDAQRTPDVPLQPNKIGDAGSNNQTDAAMTAADGGETTDAGGHSPPAGGRAGGEDTAGASGHPPEPACGDGKVDDGERCDTGIQPGKPGACPDECPGDGACMEGRLAGSMCQKHCEALPRKVANGDGCCPAGANKNIDDDCTVTCGNGAVEPGETCDPVATCPSADSCKASSACFHAALSGDANKCTASCTITPITSCMAGDQCCPSDCTTASDPDCSARCGDGQVDTSMGETCEPNTAPGCPSSCDDGMACTLDFMSGSAANCNVTCMHMQNTTPKKDDGCCPDGATQNTDSDCAAVCGNGQIETGEVCDGDCPSRAADCNDNDPCTSDAISGSACTRKCTHTPLTPSQQADGCCPKGANATTDADCHAVCGNGVIESGELCDGNCPTSCLSSGQACLVNKLTGTDCSRRCVTVVAVESPNSDGCCPSGSNANADPDCKPTCGNRVIEAGESCDDGNTTSGDGCSASCKPDDNTATPGDDRAGYVLCNGVSCGPDTRCCTIPTVSCMLPGSSSCQVFGMGCDGPEDCDGAGCFAGMVGRSCGGNGFASYCHTDKDCVNTSCSGSGNPCHKCDPTDGTCKSGT